MKLEITAPFTLELPEQTFTLPACEFHGGEMIGISGPARGRLDILLRFFGGSLPVDGGILPPRAGRVRSRTQNLDLSALPICLDGVQIYQDGAAYRKIGAIYSDPDLNILGRTVLEDYLSALVAVGAPPEHQIAAVSLRPFGLSEKLSRSTDVLSGGEKQRLNCATALAGNRSLLVGDFTNATLDQDFRKFMCRTAREFVDSGGIAILGGINPHDIDRGSFSRWFLLELNNGIVCLEEVTLGNTGCQRTGDEASRLHALLNVRQPGGVEVLTAANIHRRRVTQPVSLSIQSGEIVVLTGPNGVGKSTFGQIVVGQLGGKYIEGDLSIANGVKPVLAPQSPSEMILGLTLESELPSVALRSLCGIGDQQDAQLDPRGFSHGTQKLITVANAFRLSTGLVILDEPTSGMDSGQKDRFVALLNEFPDHAIVIITHDPALFQLGRIVEVKG